MAFTPNQTADLAGKLDAGDVKSRSQAGRNLSYIESWHAISEANRIFGFDGWDRETVETRLVSEKTRKIGAAQKEGWGVSYVCRVRITVRAGGAVIVREGIGSGHGIDVDLGLAHESAVKEAESDAGKRALSLFGNKFGLALYDKAQEGVEKAVQPQKAKAATPAIITEAAPAPEDVVRGMITTINSFATADRLKKLMALPKFKADLNGLSTIMQEHVYNAYDERIAAVEGA